MIGLRTIVKTSIYYFKNNAIWLVFGWYNLPYEFKKKENFISLYTHLVCGLHLLLATN